MGLMDCNKSVVMAFALLRVQRLGLLFLLLPLFRLQNLHSNSLKANDWES